MIASRKSCFVYVIHDKRFFANATEILYFCFNKIQKGINQERKSYL